MRGTTVIHAAQNNKNNWFQTLKWNTISWKEYGPDTKPCKTESMKANINCNKTSLCSWLCYSRVQLVSAWAAGAVPRGSSMLFPSFEWFFPQLLYWIWCWNPEPQQCVSPIWNEILGERAQRFWVFSNVREGANGKRYDRFRHFINESVLPYS